jgi:hypothetical protein
VSGRALENRCPGRAILPPIPTVNSDISGYASGMMQSLHMFRTGLPTKQFSMKKMWKDLPLGFRCRVKLLMFRVECKRRDHDRSVRQPFGGQKEGRLHELLEVAKVGAKLMIMNPAKGQED